MSAMKDRILAELPDGAEVQLYAEAERIARAAHEARQRQTGGGPDWSDLPRSERVQAVDVYAELLERGIVALAETA